MKQYNITECLKQCITVHTLLILLSAWWENRERDFHKHIEDIDVRFVTYLTSLV
jgi:hypothetical protein